MLQPSARDLLAEQYEASQKDYRIRTTPYHSVGQFIGEVVDVQVAESVAFLKFAPQEVSFFATGRSDRIDLADETLRALFSETNLQKANSTNGPEDMAIEGLSFQRISYRAQYETHSAGWGAALVDVGSQRAMLGRAPVVDPFGIITPPQLQSPFMLQDAIFQGLIKHSSVELRFDTSKSFELGLLDLLPCSNASSYLDANGAPSKESRFTLNEGLLWQRDGEPDSDLEMLVTLQRELVVPLSLVTMPGGNAAVAPRRVYCVAMGRLHGVSFGFAGVN